MFLERAQVEAALPGYELGPTLGQGASGIVVEGRHRQITRQVAIKVLTRAGPAYRAGFRREADVLAGLDHPHIVRIYDYVERGELSLLVMEHLPGGTLRSRLAEASPAMACAVGLAAADALAAAHTAGVLHRDVKPSNILFARDGAPKLVDFGISKFFGGTSTSVHSIVGTPGYMAPEQIGGERVGPGTDLYALGVVLFRLLTGTMPIDPSLPPAQLWRRQLEQPAPAPPGVPEPLAGVVSRALGRQLRDRPASAREFALQLAAAATTVLGSGWLAASGVAVRADREVLEAAHGPAVRTADPAASPGPVGRLGTAGEPDTAGAVASATEHPSILTATTLVPPPPADPWPPEYPSTDPEAAEDEALVIDLGPGGSRGRRTGRQPRASRITLAAAAGIVAVTVTLLAILLPRNSGDQAGSDDGPIATASGPSAAAVSGGATRLGKRLLGGPAGPADTANAVVTGLAVGADGVQVAVGRHTSAAGTAEPAGSTPVAWSSADGHTWRTADVRRPAARRQRRQRRQHDERGDLP